MRKKINITPPRTSSPENKRRAKRQKKSGRKFRSRGGSAAEVSGHMAVTLQGQLSTFPRCEWPGVRLAVGVGRGGWVAGGSGWVGEFLEASGVHHLSC